MKVLFSFGRPRRLDPRTEANLRHASSQVSPHRQHPLRRPQHTLHSPPAASMVASEIHGGSAQIFNKTALATTNKWASVLDEDVMAAALAAVRSHRQQKQASEPEAHAHPSEEATPSEAATITSDLLIKQASPSRSAVLQASNLPVELPPQAIAVRPTSLPAELSPQPVRRSNTATRVFSVLSSQWRSTASSFSRSTSPRPVRCNTW